MTHEARSITVPKQQLVKKSMLTSMMEVGMNLWKPILVEHGESRYAKPGTFKREAKSLDHLMTHRYSNPYCESCIRAKMRHFKTRKGSFKRNLSNFGDLITF